MRDAARPGMTAGLFSGVEPAATALLGLTNLRHRSRQPDVDAATRLAEVIFDAIATNWQACGAADNIGRSKENWRWWHPVCSIAEHNRSPEVVLERAIARAASVTGDRRWANQIPVASGLAGSGDRRRALDLVGLPVPDRAIFVELKIASDTPAYAAFELLGYAALWLLTRGVTCSTGSALLGVTKLNLLVLAPAAFYRTMPGGFGAAIDAGARRLGAEHGVDLRFGFVTLDPQLQAAPLPDGAELIGLLDASISVALHR